MFREESVFAQASMPELSIIEGALTVEVSLLDTMLLLPVEDAVRLIDQHWPNKAPFKYDHSFSMLSEPWLDDPEGYPDITESIKRKLVDAIKEEPNLPVGKKAYVIYKHWPFIFGRTAEACVQPQNTS